MVSEPRPPEPRTDGGVHLGRAISDRMRPKFVLAGANRRHSRPGNLMRSTRTFGMRLGLSQQNRHRIDAMTIDVPTSTRPPADYWPWPDADEQNEEFQTAARRRQAATPAPNPATAVKTKTERNAESQVDALREFIQRKVGGAATPFAVPENTPAAAPTTAAASDASAPVADDADLAGPGRVHRGLPMTARRNGRTWAGPKTSPGGMARGAAPQTTTSVAHNRWGAEPPEPLPDVVATGIVDSAPIQRGGRAPAARPEAREDHLRRLLEKSGQIPATTVSADDLAASLTRGESARPALDRTAPNATLADRDAPRPGGSTLARVIADAPATRPGQATSQQGLPSSPAADPPQAQTSSSDLRAINPSLGQPVSADMLRRIATPRSVSDSAARTARSAMTTTTTTRDGGDLGSSAQVDPHQASSAGSDPIRARSALSERTVDPLVPSGQGSSAQVDAPSIGRRPGAISRAPLDSVVRALPLVASSPSQVAVMDRVQRVTTDVDVEHEAVLPPRSFAGWHVELTDVEPEPIRRGPLPLATMGRQLHAHAPDRLAVARRHETEVRRSAIPATAATTTTATAGPTETSGRITASSTAVTPNAVAGKAMAVTAAGLARSFRIDPATPPSAFGLPIAAASPRRHRRAVARSLDGRGVQWVADTAATDTATSTAPNPAGSDSTVSHVTSARPNSISSDRPASTPHRTGDVDRVADATPPDGRADAYTGIGDDGTGAAEPASLTRASNDATLRRALLATDRAVALTDELAVAPPAMGHLGEDSTETAPVEPSVSGAVREPSPITSDTIRRAMQRRLAVEDAPRRNDVESTTALSIDALRSAVTAARTTNARASAASTIEDADRLVDVDAASVTSARPFLDRDGDSSRAESSGANALADAPFSPDRRDATNSRTPAPTGRGNDSATPATQPPAAGMRSPDRWVPADPGTLFSSLTGRGVLQRRSLLTLSEASIAAAARSALAAGPPSEVLQQRTMFPASDIGRVDPGSNGFDLPDTMRRDSTTGPSGITQPNLPAAGSTQPAVAPRSLQRSVDPLIDVGAVEAAPTTKRRKSRAKQAAQPLVDPADLAVSPRAVQRSSNVGAADLSGSERGLDGGSDRGPEQSGEGAGRTDPTNGAARVAAVDLADRFLAELSRHRQERPKPLPTQFASIADLIVGRRTPLVSTSEASQRALAAVNKVAATTGDVIHLADPHRLSSPDAEMRGIIAHELTHVAAPSSAPRFFDDDRHTAEEHRATEIGELMRRSSAPPSGSGSARGGSMSITQESTRSAARDSSGTIRREMDTTSQRQNAGSPSSWSSTPSPDNSGTIRRANVQTPSASFVSDHPEDRAPTAADVDSRGITSEAFTAMLRDNFDLIVELLEDRLISDIERRGGRYRGDF